MHMEAPFLWLPLLSESTVLKTPRFTPALRGGMLALLAAALFGLSTPLVQHFGQGLGAFTTAALLYAGAAAVALLMRHPPGREAALRRARGVTRPGFRGRRARLP